MYRPHVPEDFKARMRAARERLDEVLAPFEREGKMDLELMLEVMEDAAGSRLTTADIAAVYAYRLEKRTQQHG